MNRGKRRRERVTNRIRLKNRELKDLQWKRDTKLEKKGINNK